ncbi:uncharacterized protein LOC105392829 [Plutella xylostella]|uniref:uncharacterized protein LOC105392829 n=1 Tax=Plutella xylostella TaxID=51655 RepID=UPI002032A3CA|nr:uncharacterized protein LOC105392829 [Plutella xylostella]XP_048485754.1 uncharacterized protein LOC105392829 [Plutella xylostella]
MEESQSTFILYRDSEEKLGYPVRLDGLDAGLLPLLRMQRAAGDPALPAGGPPELQLYEDQYHQYCNFQVVVDNNPQPKASPSDTPTTFCYICNIPVPSVHVGEHEQSEMHVNYLRLAQNGVERISKQMAQEISRLSAPERQEPPTGDRARYCAACNRCACAADITHRIAVKKDRMVATFYKLLTDSFVIDSNVVSTMRSEVNGATCKRCQKQEERQAVYKQLNKEFVEMFKDALQIGEVKEPKVQEKEPKVQEKEPTVQEEEPTVQEEEPTVQAVDSLGDSGQPQYIEVSVEGARAAVPRLAWHGVKRVNSTYLDCCLCDKIWESTSGVEAHVASPRHAGALRHAVDQHGLRKLDRGGSHCVVCDEVAMDAGHVAGAAHRAARKLAQHRAARQRAQHCAAPPAAASPDPHRTHSPTTKPYQPYHCDVCNVTVTNNVKNVTEHNSGRTHKNNMNKNCVSSATASSSKTLPATAPPANTNTARTDAEALARITGKCTICDVEAGIKNIGDHLKGKLHKQKVAKNKAKQLLTQKQQSPQGVAPRAPVANNVPKPTPSRDEKETSVAAKHLVFCTICKTTVPNNLYNLKTHFNGARHSAAVKTSLPADRRERMEALASQEFSNDVQLSRALGRDVEAACGASSHVGCALCDALQPRDRFHHHLATKHHFDKLSEEAFYCRLCRAATHFPFAHAAGPEHAAAAAAAAAPQ